MPTEAQKGQPTSYSLSQLALDLSACRTDVPGMLHHYQYLIDNGHQTPESLRKSLGLHTPLSPEGSRFSRRAALYAKYQGEFASDGTTINPAARAEALKLHEEALDLLGTIFPINSQINAVNIHAEIHSIGGSYVTGHPRVGIHPPGMTYEDASHQQIMSGAIKRHGAHGFISVPSDIDLSIPVSYDDWDISNGVELNHEIDRITANINDLTRAIFEEYGVFVQFGVGKGGEGMTLDDFRKAGGFARYLSDPQTDSTK